MQSLRHLTGEYTLGAPRIRPRQRKARLFIDHEYITHGYCATFRHSVSVVYLVLAKYANYHTQTCFPSIDTIMRQSGITNRNTAFAAITLLEEHRLITVERSKGRRANQYTLLDARSWKRPQPSQTKPATVSKANENRITDDTGTY